MSKIYTASMLRRPASPRSDKLKAVDGGSSSSSHSSSSSSSIVPAAADSVFWKYFGLDENGDLYVKMKDNEEARNFWTYGNLSGGGISSGGQGGGGGASVSCNPIYPSTGEKIAVITIDGHDYDIYAPKALSEGTDYLSPTNVQSRIDTAVGVINALIPAAATAQNQLADKAFVNSSIASNTGAFKGTFSSTSQLPSTNVNTNDYAFVTSTDANNNTVYNRYKYNGTRWVFEYALNNSSFTAAQWSAINSGITASKVAEYDLLVSNVQADWNGSGLAAILNKPSALKNPYKLKITNARSYDGSSEVTLQSSDLTTILGYTPYNSTNPNSYQENVVEVIKVNGTVLTVLDKTVSITVPTKVSDLSNDSGFTSNVGTITGITMNSVSKGTSGVVDLGTVLTSVGLKAGGNSGTGNAQTTNGNTYLKLVVNGAYQEGVRIIGTQNVEVTSNSQGKVTITGPDLSVYVHWSELDAVLADYQLLLEPGVDYVEPSTLSNYLTTNYAASTYLAKTDFLFDIRSKNTLPQPNVNTIYDPSFGDYYGRFRYYSYVGSVGTSPNATAGTNGFPTDSNANALLTIDTYSDSNSLHLFQLGFSGNGNIYYRKGAAEKQNGSWVNPWSNGQWKKFLPEDHNGDVSIGRDLTIGRHLAVARGNRMKFDAEGTAYMCLGSSGDNSFYINAGNGTYPVYYETSALLPGTLTPDNHSLGNYSFFWGSIYAKKWYPDPSNQQHYIEYNSNGYFVVHGPLVADGQIAAGGIISNS